MNVAPGLGHQPMQSRLLPLSIVETPIWRSYGILMREGAFSTRGAALSAMMRRQSIDNVDGLDGPKSSSRALTRHIVAARTTTKIRLEVT